MTRPEMLNRVLYVWGLGGLVGTLGLFLWSLTVGAWGWACFDALLIGANCTTLWLHALATRGRRQYQLLEKLLQRPGWARGEIHASRPRGAGLVLGDSD